MRRENLHRYQDIAHALPQEQYRDLRRVFPDGLDYDELYGSLGVVIRRAFRAGILDWRDVEDDIRETREVVDKVMAERG